jgi:serine phosphatase RsbU (regulator of sigma subunit)/PAS domain-containing protein
MTSITGRRPLLTSLMGVSRRQLRLGLLAGLAVLAPIVAADIVLNESAILTSAYIFGAFAAAVVGGTTPAVIVGAMAMAAAAVSPAWNHNFGQDDYWIALAELALGGALAVVIAWLRERSGAYTGKLALLDQIGAIADGSLSLADTLDRATRLTVPAAADFALVDVVHRGEVTRAAVRARGRSDWRAVEGALRARTPSVPFWLRDPQFGIPPVPRYVPRVSDGHIDILSHGDADRAFLASLGMRSFLTVPMIARGNLLGTLTLAVAWSKRRYRRDDLAFAKALAGRLALALDNAGLFSDLESVERRMDAVMDRIPEAVTVHDANGSLVYANQAAADLIGMESAAEFIRATAPARVGRYELYTENGEPLPDDDDVVAEAVRAGNLPLHGIYRLIVVGTREERWIRASVEPISGPDGALLYAVTTIEDVTSAKRAELSQRLLARVGELLRSSDGHADRLRRAADLATPDFADGCVVSVQGENGMIERVAVAHRNPGRREAMRRLADEYREVIESSSPLAEVLRGREPALFEVTDEMLRAGARDAEHLNLMRAVGAGSAMVVPMAAGAKVVGALTLVADATSRRFDDVDLEVAVEFGRRAGLAVENARVTELRTEIATTLQRGLLPPDLPPMRGWRVATMYRPAGELNEVGGDFYEAFRIEGGWMIVLGDVVGRGADAAALTALARHTIHTAGALTSDPIAALRALNSRLREGERIPLCSAAVVVLEDRPSEAAGAIAVAAGHPLPLLVRGSSLSEAAGPGPLLGALPDPHWTTCEVELQPGDQLIVYTDGVTDARSGDELFGDQRLRVQLTGSGRPEAAVARVERALTRFAGDTVADDAALVAIMREGSASVERSGDILRSEPPAYLDD